MQAIILGAGVGKRLGPLTGDFPKICLPLGGETLLERNAAMLRRHGSTRIIVVTGFRHREVSERFASLPGIEFCLNPFFRTTNTLASLWFGLQRVHGPVVTLNGDTVFHEDILARLLSAEGELVMACDRKLCGEEEVKYRSRDGQIIELSKDVDTSEAEGEFTGLARMSESARRVLMQSFQARLEQERFTDYFEAGIEDAILEASLPARVVAVGDLPWCEIDFEQDYCRATALFGK